MDLRHDRFECLWVHSPRSRDWATSRRSARTIAGLSPNAVPRRRFSFTKLPFVQISISNPCGCIGAAAALEGDLGPRTFIFAHDVEVRLRSQG